MDCFTITWRKSTKKDLRKIPLGDVEKIIGAVEELALNPFPDGHKKLTGTHHATASGSEITACSTKFSDMY